MAKIMNASPESPVELVTVDRPEAGETLTVPTESGQRIVLAFNPHDVRFSVAGDDFILTFEDGALIVFQGLVTAAQGADAPTIQIAGIEIDAGVLMGQVLAVEAEPIETAAGEEGAGAGSGGGSHYDDSFGDVISGLAKQGVIGETELGFGLIAGDNIELPVDTAALSNGHASSGGGFDPLEAGSPSPPPSSTPSSSDDPAPEPSAAPVFNSDESDDGDDSDDDGDDSDDSAGGLELLEVNDVNDDSGGDPVPLSINGIDIITNEATGNLQIPDELILYLANEDEDGDEDVSIFLADQDVELSVSGPSYDGGTNNAHIWAVPEVALAGAEPFNIDAEPFNTWAAEGEGHVRFHIGGVGPLYQGSFTYQVTDGEGATGDETIGVENVETENDHGYWTLDRSIDGSTEGEVLLGLDGRNKITGGEGDDIIHGGHDASGDILMGGEGDDVIFGGSGNDDLQGNDGDDNFIMSAGFGHDVVNGGEDFDTITLDGVLTGDNVAEGAIAEWLSLNHDATFSHDAETNTITFEDGETYSGTINLGGGDVITFENIEQIVYTDVA
jgi:hypothetical protein